MSRFAYNYRKLRGKIREIYGTQAAFAKALGIAESTLSLKLCNKTEWEQTEMLKGMTLLGEDASAISMYFYEKE